MSNNLTPLNSIVNNGSSTKKNSKRNQSFSNLTTLGGKDEDDTMFRSTLVVQRSNENFSSSSSIYGNYINDRLSLYDNKFMNFKIDVNIPTFNNNQQLNNNQYLSKQNIKIVQKKCVCILEELLIHHKLDYTITKSNKYVIRCRFFSNDCVDFEIKMYQLINIDQNGNKSLLEIIRTTNGDFGYFDFEDIFLNRCKQDNIIVLDRKISETFSMPSLSSMSLSFDDENENEDEDENISLDDNIDDENTLSLIGKDKEYDKKLCESIIETLSSSESYREEYIHDAYQFATFLAGNDERQSNMIEYILENEKSNLIEKILAPIINGKIYDAFIILHVLKSIYNLLKLKNVKSQLIVPENFINIIQSLEDMWSNENGVTNTLGPIRINFIKSQQIQNTCQSVLELY